MVRTFFVGQIVGRGGARRDARDAADRLVPSVVGGLLCTHVEDERENVCQ